MASEDVLLMSIKIKRKDFEISFNLFEIPQKAQDKIFSKFQKTIPFWFDLIEISFLPQEIKEQLA